MLIERPPSPNRDVTLQQKPNPEALGAGEATLREPDKMSGLTWAPLDDPPQPLALAARLAVAALKADG